MEIPYIYSGKLLFINQKALQDFPSEKCVQGEPKQCLCKQ